jgi:hypothetical protein
MPKVTERRIRIGPFVLDSRSVAPTPNETFPVGGPLRMAPLALGLLFLAAHLVLVILGGTFALRQSRALAHWVDVPAVVAGATLDHRQGGRRNRPPGLWDWYPSVSYSYSVGGQDYVGHAVVATHHLYFSRGYAAEMLGRMPPGARLTAHYDPDQPESAFLIHDCMCDPYLLISIGVFLGMVAVGFLLLGLPPPDAHARFRRLTRSVAYVVLLPIASELHYRISGGATCWPMTVADLVLLLMLLRWLSLWMRLRPSVVSLDEASASAAVDASAIGSDVRSSSGKP